MKRISGLLVGYRAEDGRVWAISVRHAAGKYAGRLGPVNFDMKIADLEASLGSPALRHTIAPVLDQYVWKRDETQFVVEAYSRTYDDIARSSAHPAFWDATHPTSGRAMYRRIELARAAEQRDEPK